MYHNLGIFNSNKFFDCADEHESELNCTEFIKFWQKFADLYYKVDKSGDGDVSCDELLAFLRSRKSRYNKTCRVQLKHIRMMMSSR